LREIITLTKPKKWRDEKELNECKYVGDGGDYEVWFKAQTGEEE